jgi:hypothetical protein
MRKGMDIVFILAAAVTLWAAASHAADRNVTLMLGGKFCEAYLGEVSAALMKVPGVKAVDLKSMKGHAVVTVEEKVKPDHLASTVNAMKGDGWHCTGEVMK